MGVNKRNISLDIVRVVAILAVVMIHTSAFGLTSYERGTLEFATGNIFDAMSRLGVPLFVMISGALMLDESRTVTVRNLLCKNVKNILLLLFFWSFVYAVVFQVVLPLRAGNSVRLRAFLEAVLFGHYHLWYLYMVVGLYLATPFFRAFVKKENQSLVLFFLAIALVTQFVPTVCTSLSELTDICPRFKELSYVSRFANQFRLGLFGQYAAYYVMGWYIVHVGIPSGWKKNMLLCAGILSLIVTILFVQATGKYSNAYSNLNLLIFLYASSVFLLLTSIRWQVSGPVRTGILFLSKFSFGIYVIHPLWIEGFRSTFPYSHAPVAYILVSYRVVLAISLVCTLILSKLPVIRGIVRG